MSGRSSSTRGGVFITGTSTGIGAASALRLAAEGFRVFAGVRRPGDGAALESRARGRLIHVVIDITDGASIAAAAETVSDAVGKRGLAALVNNAGIVKPAPIEFQPIEDLRMQLEVNLIGQVAVTQAFLPLIRRGHGRIVNVGSIGGRLALPIHGAYSASKFGMEALSDALRLELRQWKIPVSLIDPGATDTAIFGKTLAELDGSAERLGDDGYRLYADQIAAIRRFVEKTAADPAPAEVLAREVAKAVMADKPKSRYLAGKGAKETAVLARTLTDHARDLAVAKDIGLPKPK
ncbi:MAG TPA: SDR family oxidoreductase [Actinomycetota bacterium]|nr:SDR family oxidoreductase [Actinomycetota bacterium]